MKFIFMFLLCLFSLTSCNFKTNEVSVSATSYIVIEQSTNKILQGNNYDVSRSVASISKIMTAIVAIENIDVNNKKNADGNQQFAMPLFPAFIPPTIYQLLK